MKRIALIIFTLLLFSPMTTLAEERSTPSGIPLTELEDVIDSFTAEYIGETVAGANIIVIKDNEIVFSKGYGLADIENGILMDPSTSVLEWGSITKLFVWVAAMQLAEQGLLDLEEDIQEYLPNGFLTKLQFDKPISMINLMNHNAGFEDNIFDLIYDSPEELTSMEAALILTEPNQVYEPGTVVAYSNYSTSLAAFVIEQITGQEFYKYVNEHILSELGMEHTTIHLPVDGNEAIAQNKAKGYIVTPTGEIIESAPAYLSLYPSGAMNGAADDLAKFVKALMPATGETSPLFNGNDTLSELLTSSHSVHESVPGIAHGFWEYDGKYSGLFHGGNTDSFSSNLHFVPEEQFAVIVLTNQANEADLSYGLIHELVGDDGIEVAKGNLPDSEIVEGTYLSARKMDSGFIRLYYYFLVPLKIESLRANEIEMNVGGSKVSYVQTSPFVYKLIDDNHGFLANRVLYFHVNDGAVEQISTTYSDYLPMDKSNGFLYITLGIFIWCCIYFLISPIVLIVRGFQRRRKKTVSALSKWNGLLIVSGTVLVVNVFVLAIRMLTDYSRAYSELYIHFGLNYLFTITGIVALIMVIIKWSKTRLTRIQKIGYVLSSMSIISLIAWLIIWQFYF